MAHKKGVGSSKNGRESESKRLGVKIFGGQKAAHKKTSQHLALGCSFCFGTIDQWRPDETSGVGRLFSGKVFHQWIKDGIHLFFGVIRAIVDSLSDLIDLFLTDIGQLTKLTEQSG